MYTKGSMTLTIVISVIVIIMLLVVGVLLFDKLLDDEVEKDKPGCIEICNSNEDEYVRNTAKVFSNSICYCKNSKGEINTYIM